MQYNKQFTNQGLDLFSQALNKQQALIIDQVLVDNLPTNNLPDLSSITADDLSNHQSYQANYTSTDGSTLTVDSVMSNDNFGDDYQVNEIAICGHIANDSSTEALVAILTATDAFVLPKQLQGDSPIKFVPTIKIQYVNSNQSNVNVQVSDGAYVARQDLDAIFNQKLGNIKAASPDDLQAVQNALQSKADKSDIDNINSRINNINTSSGGGSGSTIIPNNPSSNQPTNQFDSNGITIGGQKVSVQSNHLMYNSSKVLTDDVFNKPDSPNINAYLNDDDGNIAYSISKSNDDSFITGYTLYHKKDSDSDWNSKDLSTNKASGEINADKQTLYDLKAIAKSIGGSSDESQTQTVRGQDVPKVTNLTLYNNGSLDYSIAANGRGSQINNYTIYYKKDSDKDWQTNTTKSDHGTLDSSNYLKDGNTYVAKAKATNDIGDSKESDTTSLNYVNYNNLDYGIQLSNFTGRAVTLQSKNIDWNKMYPNVNQLKVIIGLAPTQSQNDSSTLNPYGSGGGFYAPPDDLSQISSSSQIVFKSSIFPINQLESGSINATRDTIMTSIGFYYTPWSRVEALDANGKATGAKTTTIYYNG